MSAVLSPTDPALHARRRPDHPIESLFLRRWSPRAFAPQPMPLDDLQRMLEAARWAPSAHNIQPWHFLYSLRDDQHWQAYLSLLHPFNSAWAGEASALVFLLSQAWTPAGETWAAGPSSTHSFDAGAAWAQLALQATAMGYQAHAMAGIDYDTAPRALGVPSSHQLQIAIAIGRPADPGRLPPELRAREFPSPRRALADSVSAGRFPVRPGA